MVLIASYAESVGLLSIASLNSEKCAYYSFTPDLRAQEIDRWTYHANAVFATDWIEEQYETEQGIIEYYLDWFGNEQLASYFRLCVFGLTSELTIEVLEYIEEQLTIKDQKNRVLSRLMLYPLKDANVLDVLIRITKEHAFPYCHEILSRLKENALLLSRLYDKWHNCQIDDVPIAALGALWQSLSRLCLYEVVVSRDRNQYNTSMITLALRIKSAEIRLILQKVSRLVGDALYSEQARLPSLSSNIDSYVQEPRRGTSRTRPKPHHEYERASKQILDACAAFAKGKDSFGVRVVNDLVKYQINSGRVDLAVKSLCNIANGCRDVFRSDLEKDYLERAYRLDSNDLWATIQYADYHKRFGDYKTALKLYDQAAVAASHSELEFVKACQIDVYVEMGQYDKAVRDYLKLKETDHSGRYDVALADVLRKSGSLDRAQEIYCQILQEKREDYTAESTVRAMVGLAEVHKRNGELQKSVDMYSHVLKSVRNGQYEEVVWKFGLTNVLTRMGRYVEAADVVSQVIRDYPYSLHAKSLRDTIVALSSHTESQQIVERTAVAVPVPSDWYKRLCESLFMLRINRSGDAIGQLKSSLEQEEMMAKESVSYHRLALAIAYLSQSDRVQAKSWLKSVDALGDVMFSYLVQFVDASIDQPSTQVQEESTNRMSVNLALAPPDVQKVFGAIIERSKSDLILSQIEMLLRIAA